ncbi:Elongation of very long chain fatty acids protein [Aphelenchoides besseyi]|nr:Elongation of very long chain fatty acids protein [Aphelenchoides besseyi]
MATLNFDNWDQVKANLSVVRFDYPRLLRIATADRFDEPAAKQWVQDHFYLTLQISLAYIVVVFGTKFLMRNRQPFSLFVPLNTWNFILAVFSIVGTIKLTPEFLTTVYNQGFEESYCHVRDFTKGNNGYWVWLFIVSKMFELLDTVFLVLRKRPLMFLHWYHHILTMVYAFFSYPLTPGFNRWGIYLNFLVHAFMYSYYFLRSMKIHVPGIIAKFITTLQIWQFVISVGVLLHLGVLIYLQNNQRIPNCPKGTVQCDFNPRIFVLATFMDVTYLALFINFFLQSYVFGGGKAKYRDAKNGKLVNGNAATHRNGVSNGKAKKIE